MAEDQVKDQAQEETPEAEETTETAEATEAPEAKQEAKPKDAQAQEEDLFGKTLDKMTVKELREQALTMQGIVGVHSMKKDELIEAIRDVKGIVVAEGEKKNARAIRRIKQEIRELRQQCDQAHEAGEKAKATQLRKRISRLKKQTRRLAVAS